ncbi:MAG: hypothetical protein R2932_59235 [Caldilineaceae bacterium]
MVIKIDLDVDVNTLTNEQMQRALVAVAEEFQKKMLGAGGTGNLFKPPVKTWMPRRPIKLDETPHGERWGIGYRSYYQVVPLKR